MNDKIPVVFEDGAVEYLPPDTVVEWPLVRARRHHGETQYTLGSFGRPESTGGDPLRLPDGREARIEGWKNEALRLRSRAELAEHKVSVLSAEVTAGLDRERDLRAKVALAATDTEGVWWWQGDGHDHEGSLSCPVVMSADTLRAFVAERARAGALVAAYGRLAKARKAHASASEAIAAAVTADDYPNNVEQLELAHAACEVAMTELCAAEAALRAAGGEP